jgi:hypothetical protein
VKKLSQYEQFLQHLESYDICGSFIYEDRPDITEKRYKHMNPIQRYMSCIDVSDHLGSVCEIVELKPPNSNSCIATYKLSYLLDVITGIRFGENDDLSSLVKITLEASGVSLVTIRRDTIKKLYISLSDLLSITWNNPLFVGNLVYGDIKITFESIEPIINSLFVSRIDMQKYIKFNEPKYKYYEAKTIEQKLEMIVKKINAGDAEPILLEKPRKRKLFIFDDKLNITFLRPYIHYHEYEVKTDRTIQTIYLNKTINLIGFYIWFEHEGVASNILDVANVSLCVGHYRGYITSVDANSFVDVYQLDIKQPYCISEWIKICHKYLLVSQKYTENISIEVKMKCDIPNGAIHVIQPDLNIMMSQDSSIFNFVSR